MLRDHNPIIENRYAKADTLRAEGVEPFVHRWIPSHSSAVIRANADSLTADGQPVRIAGRIMTVRHMGKASFFTLKDGSGRMQVYIKRDTVPEAEYRRSLREAFRLCEGIELGGF